MRRTIFISMVVLLLLSIALPAFAQDYRDYPEPLYNIKTFGYSNERHRHAYVRGMGFQGEMQHFRGPSYSQPLILNYSSTWGGRLKGRRVAVSIENNVAYGLLLPKTDEPPPAHPVELEELWKIPLDGSIPTKSDATYFEADDGRKYLFVGTYSSYIDVIDITDFENPELLNALECNYATDITSAPLILKWKGHNILVASTGNTGKVVIIADPLKEKSREFYINVGSGRTSSSPAPVNSGEGFAVGLDAAQGELQVFYFDEIFAEDTNGNVTLESTEPHFWRTLPAGLPASFCSQGSKLYFGDIQSRIYMFDTQTGQLLMNDSHSAVGTFSNRSPALDVINKLTVPPPTSIRWGRLITI